MNKRRHSNNPCATKCHQPSANTLSDSILQALRKITEFVTSTVVPGAESEVGFLCGAAMYARPELAAAALVPPLVDKVLRLLEGTETTGASGAEPGWVKEKGNKKVGGRALNDLLASFVILHFLEGDSLSLVRRL